MIERHVVLVCIGVPSVVVNRIGAVHVLNRKDPHSNAINGIRKVKSLRGRSRNGAFAVAREPLSHFPSCCPFDHSH